MDKEFLPSDLPEELKEILKESSWEENKIGCSKAKVFQWTNEKRTLYLKINRTDSIFSLEKERIILEWLSQRLEVPEVIYFGKMDNTEFLLLSEIQGIVSYHTESDDEKRRNIKIIAEGLKKIHSIPASKCPINNTPDKLLQLAKERIERGDIDATQFDKRWSDKSPEELFEEVVKMKPSEYDLVFSHGDYCLPNILVEKGTISGFVDWSWGGVNDRYFDFAAVMWSIAYNYGEGWVNYFLEDYGIKNIDWNRLKFFQMLNEFFQQ